MNGNEKRKSDLSGMKVRKFLSGSLIVILWLMMIPLFPGTRVSAQIKNTEASRSLDQFVSRGTRIFSNSEEQEAGVVRADDGSIQAVWFLEFRSASQREAAFPLNGKAKVKGTHTISVFDKYADVFVDSKETFGRVLDITGLVWLQKAAKVMVPPPPKTEILKEPSRAVPEVIVRNGFGAFKGKGVIVAIVDSGVDFRHPDFITYDEKGQPTSRLKYLWDPGLEYRAGRGKPAPVTYPNGVPIGTVLSRDDLTKELRANSIAIPSTDRDGHGTACASIAAGNGNADFRLLKGLRRELVRGVAPEADLIGVSLDLYRNGELGGGFLVHAIAGWLDRIAGAQPLVVSNSWGGHANGHDGNSVEERHLNALFPAQKEGRAILFAAGNDRNQRFHAVTSVQAGKTTADIKLGSVEASEDSQESKRPFGISMFADAAHLGLEVSPGTAIWKVVNPISGQFEAQYVFPAGTTAIRVVNLGAKPVRVDLYLYDDFRFFLPPFVTNEGTVGEPGTMRSAITIGSYDWNDNYHLGGNPVVINRTCGITRPLRVGALSCYSSVGPSRDGRTKPEVVSPGQWYASSLTSGLSAGTRATWNPDTTGMYGLMNGTSAATPYAAGIVALMFEKDPSLTSSEIKDLLMRHASKDPFTSINPGPEWGAGKLNYAAVERIMAALDR